MSNINESIPASQVYTAISAALLAPVLLWPALLIFSSDSIMQPLYSIHLLWLMMASALLICAVTADSIINYKSHSLWPAVASAWILITIMGISIVWRLPSGSWILALLFATHSFRASVTIWGDKHQHWHLWPAWWRDSIAALALFIWPLLLVKLS